jgi:hypothetical protein
MCVNLNVNVSVMTMRNRLSNPIRSVHQNLTACLQRHVVLQTQRTRKYLVLNTNNSALQIIPSEYDLDFHRRPGEIR